MSTSIKKISDKVNAVNTALLQSASTKLGEGVAAAQTAYGDAKSAYEAKDLEINGAGGLVDLSLADWEQAKADNIAAMELIVTELQDDSANADFDSLAELNTKVSDQNNAIGQFITGFIGAQNTATGNMINNIGTLAEAQAAFDAEFGAGWDANVTL